MLCYVKKTKSVVVYCVLTGLIQTHKSLRDGLILYGGHVQKHRRERQPKTKSLCFPSKNVCHSNLEPAAHLYGQTEQVYSHNCTYNFLSIGHKIAAHAACECAHDKYKLEGTLAVNCRPIQASSLKANLFYLE